MNKSCLTIFILFLVGCTSTRQGAFVTTKQATAIATQLANDKALKLYHCQPFQGSQPATFVEGRWIWVEQRGYGTSDIHVAVELAANGSPHKVDLQVFDMGTR